MSSTPVKGGRNVSMTKMLMSSEQYFSALELTNDNTYETERAYEDNPVEEEKPSLSQYTPVRESLHNSREETVVDKKESVSSSVEIIEKYSGPGALTDFVNPYKLGVRSSTESKDSDQNESSEDVSNDKDAAVNSDVSMSDVKSQGSIEDDPETGIRGGCRPKTAVGQLQKESDSSILLQRKGSNLKMRTLSSADITVVKDAESTTKTQGVNTDNVHGHAMQSEISEKTNVMPEVEKLKKIKLLERKMDDMEKKMDKKDNTDCKAFLEGEKPDVRSAADTGGKKVVSNILSDGRLGARIGAQASRKQASSRHMTSQTGTAIGLRPSVGEYKSPGLLLREKQRKEAERNLFSNDEGSSKPPVIISYWRKGDKVMSPLAKSKNTENNGNGSVSTQSFSSDNSGHSSTSNISEHAAKSVFSGPGDKVQMVGDLVSHYSGEKYNTPLTLLQRHVDRMRSTSQEKFKQEEKGFKQDSTTSKYAVDESVTCDSPIILDEEQERDGKSQEPLEKDVSSEQEFKISEKKSNNRNEYEGTSEISDSQREIRPSKITDIAFSKENDPKKNLPDKDEQKSKQTDSTATISEYTTPSKLLQKNQEREGVQMNSPGYGAFEYSTPSTLIQTRESEPSTQHPDNTTTSELKRRSLEANKSHERNPGYYFFNYSTPSQMVEKSQQQDQIPVSNTSFQDNTTSSQLLRSEQDPEERRRKSPGYGVFDYTTPSQLMWARENAPSGSGLQNQHVNSRGSDSHVSGAKPLFPGLGTFSYTTPSQLGMQSQPSSTACLEHRDSGLLQTDGSRPGTKQDLDPALSDITTYFRELSDMLISAFPESFSEPYFIKQHPDSSGNRFCPQNTDSYSDTGQRQPMPSQPLSVTGSTCSHKTYSPATGMSTDSGFGQSGRDSASSLSYPDSVFTPRNSSLRVTSNLSFDAYSDDEEHPSEEKRTMPKSLHLALSANEIFWKLFSANPHLSLHVLGSEFDTALHTLNQLYSSYCSGHPSTPPIPVYPVVPRGPVSASALSTPSVNPAAPYPFQMTPDRHTSQVS